MAEAGNRLMMELFDPSRWTRDYCYTYTPWCFPAPGRGFNGCGQIRQVCTYELTATFWYFVLLLAVASIAALYLIAYLTGMNQFSRLSRRWSGLNLVVPNQNVVWRLMVNKCPSLEQIQTQSELDRAIEISELIHRFPILTWSEAESIIETLTERGVQRLKTNEEVEYVLDEIYAAEQERSNQSYREKYFKGD